MTWDFRSSRSMALGVQMRVLEVSREFQPEAEHAVEADVREPDERDEKRRGWAVATLQAASANGATVVCSKLYIGAPIRTLIR